MLMQDSWLLLFASVMLLAVTPSTRASGDRGDNHFADEPDLASSMSASSYAHEHARNVKHLLSLPPGYIIRVEPVDDDIAMRALLHMNDPASRYFLGCTDPDHHDRLVISPYILERHHFGGEQERQRVLMMLTADEQRTVRPAGLLHLTKDDKVGVWDWIKELAQETKESLARKYPEGNFRFPELGDFV